MDSSNSYNQGHVPTTSKTKTFNPTVSDFLNKYPDVTMIGFCWATSWRFTLAVYGVIFAFAILFGILGALLGR